MLPHLQSMFEEYTPRGLHIFTVEAQDNTADAIRQFMEARRYTFPVALHGPTNYDPGHGIPHAWLIDGDGTVVWEGNPRNRIELVPAIEALLAQIHYPGLGRLNVHEDVARAAQSFITGRLGDARERAQEVLDNEESGEQARDDAQFVIDRVNTRVNDWLAEAEAAEQDRRYLDAQRIYERVDAVFDREDAEHQRADERLDAFRDRTIRNEIRAWQSLEQLLASIEDAPVEGQRVMLGRFLDNRRNEGTRAAEEAQARLDSLPPE